MATIVNSWRGSSAAGASATVSVPITTVSADCILVALPCVVSDTGAAATFTSVAGATLGAFTARVSEAAFPGSFNARALTKTVITGAISDTITATWSGTGGAKQLVVYEISGYDSTTPIGYTGTRNDTSGGTDFQAPCITQTPRSVLLFNAGEENNSSTTPTANMNSTLGYHFQDGVNRGISTAYEVAPGTSNYTIGFIETRTNWGGIVIEIRSALPAAPAAGSAAVTIYRA